MQSRWRPSLQSIAWCGPEVGICTTCPTSPSTRRGSAGSCKVILRLLAGGKFPGNKTAFTESLYYKYLHHEEGRPQWRRPHWSVSQCQSRLFSPFQRPCYSGPRTPVLTSGIARRSSPCRYWRGTCQPCRAWRGRSSSPGWWWGGSRPSCWVDTVRRRCQLTKECRDSPSCWPVWEPCSWAPLPGSWWRSMERAPSPGGARTGPRPAGAVTQHCQTLLNIEVEPRLLQLQPGSLEIGEEPPPPAGQPLLLTSSGADWSKEIILHWLLHIPRHRPVLVVSPHHQDLQFTSSLTLSGSNVTESSVTGKDSVKIMSSKLTRESPLSCSGTPTQSQLFLSRHKNRWRYLPSCSVTSRFFVMLNWTHKLDLYF